jgi:lipopolysaccharide transport system permease protein
MAEATPRIVIESRSPWASVNLRELWEYRYLLKALVIRDLRVKYKNMAFGIVWAILQPLFMMLIFTLFFGRIVRLPSEGLPYQIFALSGLVMWQLFSRALGESSMSLVTFGGMLSKVYFPRLIAPLATIASAAVDFCVSFAVLIAVMAYFGVSPAWTIVFAPLYLVAAVVVSLSVSLWLTALDALYRDVRIILGFVTQLWFFATPVVYATSLVPEDWLLYKLNPMLPIVQGFRYALFGTTTLPDLIPTVVSGVIVVISLVSGALFFRRVERTIADQL